MNLIMQLPDEVLAQLEDSGVRYIPYSYLIMNPQSIFQLADTISDEMEAPKMKRHE